MNEPGQIYYYPHHEIDKSKWDNCISRSSNGLIYAYSFYLDHMADEWDALVMNDYEAVMPLTWKKKYGIKYLCQPFLTAQLGVFSKTGESPVERFIEAIPASFRFAEISLNSANMAGLKNTACTQRNNYVLDLALSYPALYGNYRENIQRNIKKAKETGCTAQKNFDADQVIDLAIQQMHSHGKETAANVDRFRKLYAFLHSKEMATTYGILSLKKELIASCVFFFSHKRAYYILVGNHPNGRTIGASHALIDEFIKDYAGKNMSLDFEGSDIRNLAFFYSSFGARQEVYPFIKINRLPFYLKWIKK